MNKADELKQEMEMLYKASKEMFPEILEGEWTYSLLLWRDGDHRIEYFHTFPNNSRRLSLDCQRGEIRLLVYDIGLVFAIEDIFLFKTKEGDRKEVKNENN